MKSENIVLTVCLVFAISVITCLSVQSCKSHQFRRNISLEIDSINNKRMDSHNETDSIWQLMKKNNLYCPDAKRLRPKLKMKVEKRFPFEQKKVC